MNKFLGIIFFTIANVRGYVTYKASSFQSGTFDAGHITTKTYPNDACSGTVYKQISSVYYSNICKLDGKGGSFIESIDIGLCNID